MNIIMVVVLFLFFVASIVFLVTEAKLHKLNKQRMEKQIAQIEQFGETCTLVKQLCDMINECGPYSIRVLEFIENNGHNPKFSEYADIIISSYPNHGVA